MAVGELAAHLPIAGSVHIRFGLCVRESVGVTASQIAMVLALLHRVILRKFLGNSPTCGPNNTNWDYSQLRSYFRRFIKLPAASQKNSSLCRIMPKHAGSL
jgi:hypothetical protein